MMKININLNKTNTINRTKRNWNNGNIEFGKDYTTINRTKRNWNKGWRQQEQKGCYLLIEPKGIEILNSE